MQLLILLAQVGVGFLYPGQELAGADFIALVGCQDSLPQVGFNLELSFFGSCCQVGSRLLFLPQELLGDTCPQLDSRCQAHPAWLVQLF